MFSDKLRLQQKLDKTFRSMSRNRKVSCKSISVNVLVHRLV